MNVIIKGRQRRFVGGFIGDKPVKEIWLGDKQIWPNAEGVARRIVVELPQSGTRDWQYWVHAVDSTLNAASPSNYMKFTHEGLDFYIQHSFDGSEAYKLDGNVLTVELDGILIDQLGDSLEVQAKIPARQKTVFAGSIYEGGSRTDVSTLPMLPSTSFVYARACARRRWESTSYLTVTGKPGGDILLDASLLKAGRSWRDYGHSVTAAPESDTAWEAYSRISGGGWIKNLRVTYPAFNKVFKLKVLSVS